MVMEIENETRCISEVGKQDRCDSTAKYTLTIIHLYMADGGVVGYTKLVLRYNPCLVSLLFYILLSLNLVTFIVSPVS